MGPLTVRASRIAYRNPWLAVREDRFMRPDGSEGLYGVVERPDYALAIPWDGERLWLVRQWRHPVGAWSLEFPQGGWDAGAEPQGDAADLARLELREETGLTAGRLRHLGSLWQAVGSSDQAFDVFLATDLTAGEPSPGIDEFGLSHQALTPAELDAAIGDGRVRDCSTLAALALLERAGGLPGARAR
jgi:8-oxo-dGTP pyrophosphatase MutT (NUDIX family)